MLQGSGTIWKETFSRSGNILQMHIMEDCMEAPLMVLKIKKNKKIKKLYLKNAFHHCSHRSGRHYGKSLITLRLKCGPGKSSFQESFSRSSSATALISTRVGTPQRAKWRGRARRGRRLNWERASLRPGGNIWLMDGYRNKSWLFIYFFLSKWKKRWMREGGGCVGL